MTNRVVLYYTAALPAHCTVYLLGYSRYPVLLYEKKEKVFAVFRLVQFKNLLDRNVAVRKMRRVKKSTGTEA